MANDLAAILGQPHVVAVLGPPFWRPFSDMDGDDLIPPKVVGFLGTPNFCSPPRNKVGAGRPS